MNQKVKKHWEVHKETYIRIGLVVTTAGITTIIMRSATTQPISRGIPVAAQGGIPVLGKKVVFKDSTLNSVSYISAIRQGPPSWVVRCIETGEVFTSQKAAAEAMNIPASELSRHLNGAIQHVRGFTFERLAMAA